MSPVESAPTMRFGRFKGLALTELDAGYLSWLARQDLRGVFKGQVAEELARRAAAIPAAATAPTKAEAAELLPQELRDGEPVSFAFSCPSCGRRTIVRGQADTK